LTPDAQFFNSEELAETRDQAIESHRAGLAEPLLNIVDGDTNVWYWIGTHADHDVFTGKK
jgi:hypothetical protein